jgi:hypothetical protein
MPTPDNGECGLFYHTSRSQSKFSKLSVKVSQEGLEIQAVCRGYDKHWIGAKSEFMTSELVVA